MFRVYSVPKESPLKNYKQGRESIELEFFFRESSDGTKGGLETEVRRFNAPGYTSRRNSNTKDN